MYLVICDTEIFLAGFAFPKDFYTPNGIYAIKTLKSETLVGGIKIDLFN